MNKNLIIVFLSLYSLNSTAKNIEPTLTYGIGERNTTVDWNIAGNLQGTSPNVISELIWQDIKSRQVSVGSIWTEGDYFLQASGEYGKIYSGQNQDSDYNLDNRQGEFSRSVNNAGKGYMLDLELNYGKSYIVSPKLKVDASLGYSGHRQNLKMYEGNQIIGSASLVGLDSLYQSNWSGPQVGVGMNYKNDNNIYSLNYTHQNIDLNGHTNWNLRPDLKHPVSMTQTGSGTGNKISAGYERSVSNFSSLSLLLSRYNYSASGTHVFHTLSGDPAQKLNEVNWQANDIKLIYRSLF
jgi:hypothetical protein